MRTLALSALLLTSCAAPSAAQVATAPSHHPMTDGRDFLGTTTTTVARTTTTRATRSRLHQASSGGESALPPRVAPPAGPLNWAALRNCESGGDYANKRNPIYRGGYQFSRSAWVSVGGSGDPADASPAEQDMRAQRLYERRGRAPWPYCGRFL